MRLTITLFFVSVALFGFTCDRENASTPQPARHGLLPIMSTLQGDPIETLLPPDAIPAIDAPRFERAADAKFMAEDEPVVGVVVDGFARAYSTWHLDRHEIVNDVIGRTPVAVTW